MPSIQIQKKWLSKFSRSSYKNDLLKVSALLELDANTSVSITIRDDAFLQKYNQQFRGIDSATDVLSFESGEIDPETGSKHLGDILISYDRVLTQSSNSRHSEYTELMLLTVHGLLHLLGYDHANPQEKAIMWRKQTSILNELGITGVDTTSYDE